MNFLIALVVKYRWAVIGITLLLTALGVNQAMKLPIDAVPDITNVQVQINTETPGYSPLESEQRVSYPVENAMQGLPKLDYTRSISRYGLSQVTVIFEDGTDIYWARQLISERLQGVRNQLPAGLEPELGPIATGLGEIYVYQIVADANARQPDGSLWDEQALRTLQDWTIRPQLMQVRGITEINAQGGSEKHFDVVPEPEKLLALGIGVDTLVAALERNNQNLGAGYIEHQGEQWLVRVTGQLSSLDEIGNRVITERNGTPVRVRDVARLQIGKEQRTGAATFNGEPTVLATAMMLPGENSRDVATRLAAKLEDVKQTLPQGVTIDTLYDRTTLVEKTLATVQKNLLEGAVLVIAVLFALLGNLRAALITACIIPLSMLFAASGMAANRVSGNLMSLGAIDFGLIVDGAVIVVENCLARLALAQKREGRLLTLQERLSTVTSATREVLTPATFGILIIMVVYLPIFALSGVEGKMFHPMAFTVVAALLGALILSVTFVPAAVAIFVKGRVQEHDNWLMRKAQNAYQPILKTSLSHGIPVVAGALLLIIATGFLATRMGSEFIPNLDEGDIALHAMRIPGTSLSQSEAMQEAVEKRLLEFPEVDRVYAKIGTPEVATDPMPPNVADTFVMLKPRADWPNPRKRKEALVAEMEEALEKIPGNNYEFSQPIQMRFNELIAGVRSDVAVRFYGDDLDVLAELGEKAETLLNTIPGAADVRLEQMSGLPLLTINPRDDVLGRLGLEVAELQEQVQMAIGGINVGLVFDGDKRFPLRIRFSENDEGSLDRLQYLPILLERDGRVQYWPLGELAELELAPGPNQVNRENGKRNAVVTANVRNRDLGSFVTEAREKIRAEMELPPGYWVNYGGTFEQLESASKRLTLVVPLALALIFALLLAAFKSVRDSLLIFSAIPLALTGGVLALWLRDIPLSISAGVGFIALSGIAVLNGVVMLSYIKQLRETLPLDDAIFQGAIRRLRPVLMTALVAGLGFVPMAFNTGIGSEVQRPLATVVIGGIVSATLLTLVVLPTLYRLVNKRSKTSTHES